MNRGDRFVGHISFIGMDRVSTDVLVAILPQIIRRGPEGKQLWSALLVTRHALAALVPNRTNVTSADLDLI